MPAAPKAKHQASPQAQASAPSQPRAQAAAPPTPRKQAKKAPVDVLHNPSLTLDKPSEDGFDPYNTGAFNRSTSWERIGRNKKR